MNDGDDLTGALHAQFYTTASSSLAVIKPADSGSPGKMAVERERERERERLNASEKNDS